MQLTSPLLQPRIGSESSNLRLLNQIKRVLESIFPLSAAETTTIVAPSTKEFPGGGRFSDSVAGIFASFSNQFKQRWLQIISSKDSILSKRSRSCLFVRHFSLISRHLVPVVALTHLLNHELSRLRSSNSSAQVSRPHRRSFMTVAMKRRRQIIGLSSFWLQKTPERSEPNALEAWLILRSMSGRSLRSLEIMASR